MPYTYFLLIILSFNLGGILFSYHLPKIIKGIDITSLSNDHNPGTTNAVQHAGWFVGILCLICDMAKGFVPVFIAMRIVDSESLLFSFIMVAPVAGHAIAPLYKRNGGKAIATSFGVLCGLLPTDYAVLLLAFWYIFFSVFMVIRPTSQRSIVTYRCFFISTLISMVITRHFSYGIGCLLIACIVIYKHKKAEAVEKTANETREVTV